VYPTVVQCTNRRHGEYLASVLGSNGNTERRGRPFKCHVLSASVSAASNKTDVNLELELDGIEAHGAPAYPNNNARLLIPVGKSENIYSHSRALDPRIVEFHMKAKSGDVLGALNKCESRGDIYTLNLKDKKDRALLDIVKTLADIGGIDLSGNTMSDDVFITESSCAFGKPLWKKFRSLAKQYLSGTTPPIDLADVAYQIKPLGKLPKVLRDALADLPGLSAWMVQPADMLGGEGKRINCFVNYTYVSTTAASGK